MPGIALSADDGMQVVEWWREYCAEQGRPFRWPVLTSQTLWHLIKYGSVEFCDWWWKDTVRQLGTLAIERMRDMVNLICDHGRRDLLDWYWDVCQTHNNKRFFKLAFRSHPRRPFFHLSVIEWWNAKVESGQVSEHVFDFWDADGLPLDVLFSMLEPLVMELDALDWWWARRERFGLEAHLSPLVFAHLMTSEQYALLQWYLNRCTRDSPLPDLTLSNLSAMFAAGQVGLVEQIWQLSVAHALLAIDLAT
ncbi:hypothetical protein BC828DRAFT_396729 [Blastocladiella britannica]|nr:hypothetical protein BC828DRAFT_396729 [Blastocladiella britannica]